MFDFSNTSIGRMPQEDIYRSGSPIGDATAGISPEMRAGMNRRYAREEQLEDRFNTLLAGGASPLSMALAYPEMYYRRTGKEYETDLNGQPYLRDADEPMAMRQARIDSWLADRTAARSGEAAQGALRDEMLRRDLEAYSSPVATALRQLDPNTARRLALAQTPYVKTYGYEGAPSEAQAAQELERTRQAPAMRKQALEEREYEEAAPTREFAREGGKRKLELEERKQKLDALGKELDELGKALQSEYSEGGRARIYNRMQEIAEEMRTLAGMAPKEKAPPVSPKEAQANPSLFKGQRFYGTDERGRRRIYESNGKEWVDIGPAPAGVSLSGPARGA